MHIAYSVRRNIQFKPLLASATAVLPPTTGVVALTKFKRLIPMTQRTGNILASGTVP